MSKEKMYSVGSVDKIYAYAKERGFKIGKEAGYREFAEQNMFELGKKLGVDLNKLSNLIEESRNENYK